MTQAQIKAAVEDYGSPEDIPNVKYYVSADERKDCDEILSGILNVGIEARFGEYNQLSCTVGRGPLLFLSGLDADRAMMWQHLTPCHYS